MNGKVNLDKYINSMQYKKRVIMELIEETEKAGSLCTRIMGAGGGGFFICWAPKYKHDSIKSRINVKTWVEVRISASGSQIIFSGWCYN